MKQKARKGSDNAITPKPDTDPILPQSLATMIHHEFMARGRFKASRWDLQLRDYEGILEWINEYQPHPDGQWYVDDESGLVLPK